MSLDAFRKVATTTTTKKKSDKIELTNDEFAPDIEQWIKAKAAKKSAEQDMAEAEGGFLATVESARVAASIKAGENKTTVLLNGKLSISKSKRYSVVKPEHLPMLSQIFGEEDAARYFKTTMTVKVKPEILEDDAQAAKLIEILGPHIAEFFDVTEALQVKETFHNERSTSPSVAKKAEQAFDDGLLKNAKAAVKLA